MGTTVTDQLNRSIYLPGLPQRIVSVVPSQTELLYDLGLGDRVLGVTKFCVHPRQKPPGVLRVGGTKQLDVPLIHSLRPDLVVANKEENERGQVEALAERWPVWVSDVATLDDALRMVQQLGDLTGCAAAARHLCVEIEGGFGALPPAMAPLRAAYLIWRKPWMVAGGGTFIDDMLRFAGMVNVFADSPRYPAVSDAQLAAARPDVVLLSSEPYPFRQKHEAALRDICPGATIKLVDGELFSWYGSRLRLSAAYFRELRQALGTG